MRVKFETFSRVVTPRSCTSFVCKHPSRSRKPAQIRSNLSEKSDLGANKNYRKIKRKADGAETKLSLKKK